MLEPQRSISSSAFIHKPDTYRLWRDTCTYCFYPSHYSVHWRQHVASSQSVALTCCMTISESVNVRVIGARHVVSTFFPPFSSRWSKMEGYRESIAAGWWMCTIQKQQAHSTFFGTLMSVIRRVAHAGQPRHYPVPCSTSHNNNGNNSWRI